MQIGDTFFRLDRPKTARLSNRMTSIFRTIQRSIDEKQPFPPLIQIYACIDACGALLTQDGFATKKSFKAWAHDYLLRAKLLPCNEKELYYARCGILHTLRYDAKHSRSAREIVYGFNNFDDEIKRINPVNQVGVYIEDLFEALYNGYESFADFLETSSDPTINTNLKKLPEYRDVIPIKLPPELRQFE